MMGSFLLAVTGALIGFRIGHFRMAGDAVTLTCWTLTGFLAGGGVGEVLTSFRKGRTPDRATPTTFAPGSFHPVPVRSPVADVDKTLEMDKQQEFKEPSLHAEETSANEAPEHAQIAVQRSRRRLV